MLGLETLVEIGKQVDAATFNTTARQALNVYKVTGGQTKTRPEDPILNGGFENLSDPTEPAPGLTDHKITVEVPLCIAQLPYWLEAFFGDAVTTGTAPDFAHAFKSGVSPLPYISIHERLQTGDFRRHVGCVGEEIRIPLDPSADGFGRAMLTFIGREEQRGVTAAAGTVTAAPTLDRPAEALANVSWNGVSGGQILTGELTFKRKLKRIRAADGTGVPRAVEIDGKSTLGGSIKIRYANQTILSDAWTRTQRAVVMELKRSAARGFTFTAGQALLDEVPVPREGPDGVEMEIPLTAYQSAANAALLITALNGAAEIVI